MTVIHTELDALLSRVREDRADPTGKNRNAVAYDCWRMFEDLAVQFKEESTMRDRYKRQSDSWRDKALELADQTQWRPIATAPKDTYVLIGWFELPGQKSYATAMFHSTKKHWCNTWMAFAKDANPTHWMPLQEPPK